MERHPSSYARERELLRWRVALVLVVLVSALMLALGILNTRLGIEETARLAWIVFALNALSLVALFLLPRRYGVPGFFATILGLLVFTVGFGWWNDHPLHHWGYLFPPVAVFLFRAWLALAAMLLFGLGTVALASTHAPLIEVVRFASVYGLLVCFVTTYALLEERAGAMLRELGERDALTGCLNRRSFNEAMAQRAAARTATPLGVLLVDVDRFKAVNDRLGHLEGDRVLAAVAGVLERAVPDTVGRVYRYGGEEFVVLAEGRGPRDLALLGEAIRAAVAAGGEGLEPGTMTVSIGFTAWAQDEPPEVALARADAALYAAKHAGRDRVVDA
ncbi:MAG: GGDEF domain-containing protein [Xanthomonadaceae bacterium]|nr:GGDEF domain-containing protein [Xanthomonadaceae bacterium]